MTYSRLDNYENMEDTSNITVTEISKYVCMPEKQRMSNKKCYM